MLVSNLIPASYLRATGTVSTLTSSDGDWTKLLQLADYYQQTWANEPGVDWVSLYSPAVACGTVTATDTFSLDSSIHKVSQGADDPVRIYWTDGVKYTDFIVVSPDRLKDYAGGNYVAVSGNSLKFARTFTAADPEFGGTINVPAYTLPAALTGGTDTIAVDNPYWLVTMCAAEYTRNNLVRQNQYPNLLAEANELMKKMIENNDPQQDGVVMHPVALGRSW